MLRQAAMSMLAVSCCAAQDRVLWKHPGAVENINFDYAAGGLYHPPREPFYFLAERFAGSSPKVLVRNSASVQWRVKADMKPAQKVLLPVWLPP